MIIEHFSADIPRRRIQKDSDSSEFEAISFQRHFLAPPGEYILEAAVLDHYSAKAARRRTPFEIPERHHCPILGNIVLVRQSEPLGADDAPQSHFATATTDLTPNLSGLLTPGTKVISIFLIAHSAPHSG